MAPSLADVPELHRRASEEFGQRVEAIGDGQLHLPTPCVGWDVRELLAHVVGENRWTSPLLAGQTIAEVGDRFEGDLLGDDPKAAWTASTAGAVEAVGQPGAMAVTAHLSFGDVPGEEYVRQLIADLLVHGWDLARAVGADERFDPEVVDGCAQWFAEREELYRQAGVIGPRTAVPDDADAQTRLLAAFGRDASDDDTLSVVRRFNDAFGRRDADAVMALMTDDCVFEDTSAPNGRRHEGQRAVRAAWEELFGASPQARFEVEEGVVAGDRAMYRWVYRWDDGHVRGVDVFRVSDGKVAEKLSYVKG